ncbi:MAG TPA: SMP-30/gluconolactonase/LRE family protein [Cyclobacteriaceae bacterium]|nr:SMP-30/gluconolactonase/LRE family protein [Cyclobacteriaceae bacterium]
MKVSGYFLIILFCACSLLTIAQEKLTYYQSSDLTAENLFTKNIEGPQVDSKHNLYVVNFEQDGTIASVDKNGSVKKLVILPSGSTGNSIMINSKGSMLIADFTGHNILRVDMKTKAVTVYCHNDQFNQPNDLTINKNDQLFASDPNWKEGTGKLWRIEPDGKPVLLKDGMGTTNGIELSPDEKTLYVNESVQRKIWAFDVDSEGNISNQRLFTEFPDHGLDGMKCDNQGNLYVTRYGKGTIAIFSSNGVLQREVEMKGKKTSNLVFGGKDGRNCFVTLQDRKGIETFRSEFPGRKWKK